MAGNFHTIFLMKVFITGGTGFIGSHLIDYLLKKGFEVFALVRNLNNLNWLKGQNINFLKGDLLSIPPLPSDINFVFHLAGLTKASKLAQYYTVNQQGTASLFQSLISQKIFPNKIICLSSIAASGPSLNNKAVNEDDTPRPVSPYGLSKLKGEEEALKYKNEFSVIIFRVAAVFGPRDREFLHYFTLIKKGILPSIWSSQRLLSLCYIKDLVRALYICTQKEIKSGEIINIADSRPYYYDEMGITAGQIMEKKLKKVALPLPIVCLWALISEVGGVITNKPSIFNRYKFKEIKQKSWIVDTQKAEKKLCFRTQHSLEDALRETIQWYIQNHWL